MTWWDWGDPEFGLAALTLALTALIPGALWCLDRRDGERARMMRELQAASLASQERIHFRQRRDALLVSVSVVRDPVHLGLLWEEVREYDGHDARLLRRAFRANPQVHLPGSAMGGLRLDEDLADPDAVGDYVDGLERRYGDSAAAYQFWGLAEFVDQVRAAEWELSDAHVARLAELLTGPCAVHQRPGHLVYCELVGMVPALAGRLLYAAERMPADGLRLNALTGVLLAVKAAELDWGDRWPSRTDRNELRQVVPTPLAHLLQHDVFRSFAQADPGGSSEPASATVAWLVRAVGWLCDVDNHVALRMVENLAPAIASIPERDRGWGVDDRDIRAGFAAIREKQPALWASHGAGLEAVADEVGPWRVDGG